MSYNCLKNKANQQPTNQLKKTNQPKKKPTENKPSQTHKKDQSKKNPIIFPLVYTDILMLGLKGVFFIY